MNSPLDGAQEEAAGDPLEGFLSIRTGTKIAMARELYLKGFSRCCWGGVLVRARLGGEGVENTAGV